MARDAAMYRIRTYVLSLVPFHRSRHVLFLSPLRSFVLHLAVHVRGGPMQTSFPRRTALSCCARARIYWGKQIAAGILKSRYLAHDPVCIIDRNGDLSSSDRARFTLVRAQ